VKALSRYPQRASASRRHLDTPRLDDSAAAADALPHRRKYLLLVNGFLRRLLGLHSELIREVERELAPPEP
jgi:hypothetical protein